VVSDERALATWLAGRDDHGLAATLAARGVSAAAPWHDFFDAAEALLDAAAIDRALLRLPRTVLSALAAAGTALDDPILTRLALLDERGKPYAAVQEQLDALLSAHPAAFAPPADPRPRTAADQQLAATAAERAFTTAASLADVLLACLHSPFPRTGSGTVSSVERKRLVEGGAIREEDDLEDLLAAAAAAGLAVAADRQWVVTAAGEEWLQAPTSERWVRIVEGFRDALPEGLRTPDGGVIDPSQWSHAYPLDPEWPARIDQIQRIGAQWGLVGPDREMFVWTPALREGAPADPSGLAAHLPAEIDRVYLQADLTAIAPGPLAPALDLRLRSIAARESRAQASTYRFTAESLGAGMTGGETAGSIREFLAQLSLTGIPQPLEYLIDTTAARHGLVRIGFDAASERTTVSTPDASLRDTIAVDQALRALGLLRDGDRLLSRVPRDAVYWTLADAKYPVVAVDEDGSPELVRRRSAAPPPAAATQPEHTYERLIAVLRGGHGTDGEEGWLGRELEQAVRARSEIVVVVRMPDGSERSLTLEASGLGGGRLRGRDRAADIERTLPVSSIQSVRPA
jgi:hypothetical protein